MADVPIDRISTLGFIKEFRRQHEQQEDAPFLFILGAGASRASGIKTGAELVRIWLEDLFDQEPDRIEPDFDRWLQSTRAGIPNLNPADPAASYPQVFERRFRGRPAAGWAFLEEQMRDKRPSYGYAMLARIMATTQHRIVITTNFDNLVADSLLLCSETYPLVCGHEALARFAGTKPRRPLVLKVHRDLFLEPRNTTEELHQLAEAWRKPLIDLLARYTPVVIGYGGNDGSLMGLLEELEVSSLKNSLFWCYREEDGIPSQPILNLVAKHQGRLVPIPDFDSMMFLLGRELGAHLGKPHELVRERAEAHATELEASLVRITKLAEDRYFFASTRGDGVPSPGSDASLAVLVEAEKTRDGTGEKTWWDWLSEAEKETDLQKQVQILSQGVEALPKSPQMLGGAAMALAKLPKADSRAEQLYERAIQADPKNSTNLGNYALFLETVLKDHKRAEQLYERAIQADPKHANNLGNYAVFLKDIRKDHGRAEQLFERAFQADPQNSSNLGNYANFLMDTRKDYEQADQLYERAIRADPKHALHLGNYAVFLMDREDHERAEQLYERAIQADPKHPNNLGNYAGFLLAQGRRNEGLRRLAEALIHSSEGSPALRTAVEFYRFAHGPSEEREPALRALHRLIVTEGVRSPGWKLSDNVSQAIKDGHPEAEWLAMLASVISGQAEVSTLDAWPAWSEAASAPGRGIAPAPHPVR